MSEETLSNIALEYLDKLKPLSNQELLEQVGAVGKVWNLNGPLPLHTRSMVEALGYLLIERGLATKPQTPKPPRRP